MLSQFTQYLKGTQTLPGERKLVQKLDFFILSFCCLMYFLNYLDRSNLNNAYVSGMKEDLNFHGKQLNQINTVFTVGYTIGQVPCNIALYYFKPRFFFPTMMVIWAGLTMATAGTHSPQGIMAIRFFQAIAESSTFVGTHYILGSWYTEKELGKRSGIFTASGLAGTMIGGFIQTGIHKSMDGQNGLAGWRWLFIVDGIITLPVALYGYLLFPDTPTTTTAPYLSEEEKAHAQSRLPPPNKGSPLTFSFLKRCFLTWPWYLFTGLWIIAGETESFSSNALMALYMKAHPTEKYTISQLNNYPTGVPAVGIVSTIFWATLTDFLNGKRALVGYFIAVTAVCTSAMLLAYPPTASKGHTTIHFAAYYWSGSIYACQAVFFAWANDVLRYEEESLRAVVIASMNMGSNAINAWWSIVFYSADQAPAFRNGAWAMLAVGIALAFWTAAVSFMQKRTWRKKRAELEIDREDGMVRNGEGSTTGVGRSLEEKQGASGVDIRSV
ncbi:MFS general substrate transporter [Delitschia confertaspora ATCC 74209]|uniref:MFS general substrate transporter n=1 Tax=Delitschia confertaspora ATCC 74209 TaxID=1513339 RepID=A0A9P4JC14_9PLEO|nr:MFS general substrate transporter [Delitschia confertaspora ATCC 74209]